jgi:hypothetical protein
MVKKFLMIMVFIFFLLGIVTLLLSARQSKPVIDSLPFSQKESSDSPAVSLSPTPTPDPELSAIENDLKLIGEDLKKIKEEKRLDPPSFIFSLGI